MIRKAHCSHREEEVDGFILETRLRNMMVGAVIVIVIILILIVMVITVIMVAMVTIII